MNITKQKIEAELGCKIKSYDYDKRKEYRYYFSITLLNDRLFIGRGITEEWAYSECIEKAKHYIIIIKKAV